MTTSGGGPAFFAMGEPARRIKTRSGADGPLEKARQDGIAHLIEKWRSIDSYLSTKLFFSISIAPPSTTQSVFVSSAARSSRHCSPPQFSASAELRQYKWAQGVDSVVSAPDCKTQPHTLTRDSRSSGGTRQALGGEPPPGCLGATVLAAPKGPTAFIKPVPRFVHGVGAPSTPSGGCSPSSLASSTTSTGRRRTTRARTAAGIGRSTPSASSRRLSVFWLDIWPSYRLVVRFCGLARQRLRSWRGLPYGWRQVALLYAGTRVRLGRRGGRGSEVRLLCAVLSSSWRSARVYRRSRGACRRTWGT